MRKWMIWVAAMLVIAAMIAVSAGTALGKAVHQDCTAQVGKLGIGGKFDGECSAVTTPSGNTNGHFHNHPKPK